MSYLQLIRCWWILLIRVQLKVSGILFNLLIFSLPVRIGSSERAICMHGVIWRQVTSVSVSVRTDSPAWFHIRVDSFQRSGRLRQRHLPDVSVVVSVSAQGLLVLFAQGARILIPDLLLFVKGFGVTGSSLAPSRGQFFAEKIWKKSIWSTQRGRNGGLNRERRKPPDTEWNDQVLKGVSHI